jgi:hypothetical protein
MIRKVAGLLLPVAAFALLFARPAAAQYEHADLKNGKVKVRSVLILAPSISVQKIGLVATTPSFDASNDIGIALSDSLNDALTLA